MFVNISRKKPVQIFLIAAIISMAGIYWLCDYYLNSVGHELMLNWVRTESALIQEGNLLTSSTKNQRFLLSSDYIRAVKLVKIDNEQVRERLQFGVTFNIEAHDIPAMLKEVVVKRVGFLHSHAFYKIPGRDEMFIIFDVESKVLDSVFLGGVAVLLLMLIILVATIRFVENQEFLKREEIFKQALNDFISEDRPSKIVEKELPTLMSWWRDRKEQVTTAQRLAVQNQSKIMLGEIASRVGHDIVGSVRNIEILARRTTGLSDKQKEIFQDSINKVKAIAADISKQTQLANREDLQDLSANNDVDLIQVMSKISFEKQIQFEEKFKIKFESNIKEPAAIAQLNGLELERVISNIINNAVEASSEGSLIMLTLDSTEGLFEIQIKDTGKGIPPDNLHKIGTKGFTSGKENGTGIGIFYAKLFAEGLGGRFSIESKIGCGTTVSLFVPRLLEHKSESIKLAKGQHLIILEDQQVIRECVRKKLKDSGLTEDAYSIFPTSEELEQWLANNKTDFKLYSDYFLENEHGEVQETGVEIIQRLGLADKSVLFTSASDDSEVVRLARRIQVPIISKEQFFAAPVETI